MTWNVKRPEPHRYAANKTEDPLNLSVQEVEGGRHPKDLPVRWEAAAGEIVRCYGHAPDEETAHAILERVQAALMGFYRPGDEPGPLSVKKHA